MRKRKIPQSLDGQRLDLAVKELLGVSRGVAQQLIKNKHVDVNERPVSAHTIVHTDDLIEMEIPPARKNVKKIHHVNAKLEILYEDKDVLVIVKPSGLLVHEAPGKNETTLVDALVKYNPKIKKVGDPKRPGLVQRLDKEVSGVMIVAKTPQSFDYLKGEFAARRVKKEYVAVVYGNLAKMQDTITFRIARSREKARMVARPSSQEGKEAITHYEVLKRAAHHDLVAVRIETGRTHQIRAHLHALGHPIVGDPLYKIKRFKPLPVSRIMLHSKHLSLTLPNGEKKTFESTPPDELLSLV